MTMNDDRAFHQVESGPGFHADGGYVALIDRRTLERECLSHSLAAHHLNRRILTFSQLRDWEAAKDGIGLPAAVLYYAAHVRNEATSEIAQVVAAVSPAAVVVMSDDGSVGAVLDLLTLGARGFIPNSVNIDICVQAISLAIAGGRFIPASSLLNIGNVLGLTFQKPMSAVKFTRRQFAIAEALRCGKGNRDIAQDMKLCESTIKVHVRNIMRKLGATNRTEVAYKLGDIACQQ